MNFFFIDRSKKGDNALRELETQCCSLRFVACMLYLACKRMTFPKHEGMY